MTVTRREPRPRHPLFGVASTTSITIHSWIARCQRRHQGGPLPIDDDHSDIDESLQSIQNTTSSSAYSDDHSHRGRGAHYSPRPYLPLTFCQPSQPVSAQSTGPGANALFLEEEAPPPYTPVADPYPGEVTAERRSSDPFRHTASVPVVSPQTTSGVHDAGSARGLVNASTTGDQEWEPYPGEFADGSGLVNSSTSEDEEWEPYPGEFADGSETNVSTPPVLRQPSPTPAPQAPSPNQPPPRRHHSPTRLSPPPHLLASPFNLDLRPESIASVDVQQPYVPPSVQPPPARRAVSSGSVSHVGASAGTVPDNGRPTAVPTPGHPLLKDGKLLVYPVGYECGKCALRSSLEYLSPSVAPFVFFCPFSFVLAFTSRFWRTLFFAFYSLLYTFSISGWFSTQSGCEWFASYRSTADSSPDTFSTPGYLTWHLSIFSLEHHDKGSFARSITLNPIRVSSPSRSRPARPAIFLFFYSPFLQFSFTHLLLLPSYLLLAPPLYPCECTEYLEANAIPRRSQHRLQKRRPLAPLSQMLGQARQTLRWSPPLYIFSRPVLGFFIFSHLHHRKQLPASHPYAPALTTQCICSFRWPSFAAPCAEVRARYAACAESEITCAIIGTAAPIASVFNNSATPCFLRSATPTSNAIAIARTATSGTPFILRAAAAATASTSATISAPISTSHATASHVPALICDPASAARLCAVTSTCFCALTPFCASTSTSASFHPFTGIHLPTTPAALLSHPSAAAARLPSPTARRLAHRRSGMPAL